MNNHNPVRHLWSELASRSVWSTGLVVFAIALAVRIALIFVIHTYRDLDRYELERTALSLAQTGVYGNPYAIPTGPTAHVSPGYTVILAGIFRLFGTGESAEFIKNFFAAIVTSLQCALLPAIAIGVRLDRRIGLVAGLFCALFPFKALTQLEGDWEAPYTALFLMATTVLVTQLWSSRNFSVRNAVLNGFTWGLGILFASVLLPILGVVVLAGLWFVRGSAWRIDLRRYALFAGVELAVVLLCLAPWIIRNERALGSPIATRSNLGIELRVSNNDDATSDQRVNYLLGVYNLYHPLQNARIAEQVRAMGEVAFNKLEMRTTEDWIRSHPQRFVALTLGRIRCFWFYPEVSRAKGVIDDALAILAFAALAPLFSRYPVFATVAVIELLFYSAPSYLIHVGTRQRYPIDWLLTLMTTYFLFHLTGISPRRSASTPGETANFGLK